MSIRVVRIVHYDSTTAQYWCVEHPDQIHQRALRGRHEHKQGRKSVDEATVLEIISFPLNGVGLVIGLTFLVHGRPSPGLYR